MTTEANSTDLMIKLPAVMTVENFTEAEFEKLYAKVKEAVDQHIPDTTTQKGRTAIAALAHKVARTKTTLVAHGKKLTEEWRTNTKKVNAVCNKIEESLDALKVSTRKPLDDWEKAEADRVEMHEDGLAKLRGYAQTGSGHTSASLKAMLAEVEATIIDEKWEEFIEKASLAKRQATEMLSYLITAAEKSEADARELETLRAEKEERDRLEAQRLAAVAAAREEAERAEREYQEEEARKAEAARVEQAAREAAEREAKARIEAAEQKARDAEVQAQRAAEAERERIAAEKRAREDAEAARARDLAHRQAIHDEACAALIQAAGITPEQGLKIIDALASGLIPHVTISY